MQLVKWSDISRLIWFEHFECLLLSCMHKKKKKDSLKNTRVKYIMKNVSLKTMTDGHLWITGLLVYCINL